MHDPGMILSPVHYNVLMVSVTHSVAAQGDFEHSLQSLGEALSPADSDRLRRAVDFAQSFYGDRLLGSGEAVWATRWGCR